MNKKKRYILIFTAAILLIILSACASVAPVTHQNYEEVVRSKVQLNKNEQIIFANSFEWLPRTYGYEKTMQLKIDKTFYKGILACTERSLYFLAKMGNTYVPRLKMDYTEIVSVDLQKYGLGRRLIVQNKEYKTHTFQGITASGYGVDRQKTETAYQLLKQKCKK